MKVRVQVVTITDDGQEITQEVAFVERQDLTPETLGLSLAAGKALLQAIQEVVVEWQLHAYLRQQRTCPQCGKMRRRRGMHHRDRALFPLVYHHGLRASEVSLLQRQDIHDGQSRIYLSLQPEDLRRLRAYLRTRKDDSPALCISARGLPLERRSY